MEPSVQHEFNVRQLKRVSQDWSKIAGEPVEVEEIKGVLYGAASELGVLRLFHKYRGNPRVRAQYSKNLGTWVFSLDT